jgi:hypothetical protein
MERLFSEKEKKLIEKLSSLKNVEVDLDFIRKFRVALLEEISQAEVIEEKPTWQKFAMPARFALTFAGIIALVLGLAGGVVLASQKSLPNDLLYPVKLAAEKTKLALAPNEISRTELRVQFAETRLKEAEVIGSRGDGADSKVAAKSLDLYEGEITKLHQEIDKILDTGDQEKLLLSLYSVEKKIASGLESLDQLQEKMDSQEVKDEEIKVAIAKARQTAELGLNRTGERIVAIQKKQGKANGEDTLANLRISRTIAQMEARLVELESSFNKKKLERIESLSETYPLLAYELDEIPVDEKEREIAEDLAFLRNSLETLKKESTDRTKYLLIVERIDELQNILSRVELELGE